MWERTGTDIEGVWFPLEGVGDGSEKRRSRMNFRVGRRRCSSWKNLDMLIVRTGLLCPRLESRGSRVQRGPLSSMNGSLC